MDLRIDKPCYRYTGEYGIDGTCHLRLYWGQGEAVVVATEVDHNEGPLVAESWPVLSYQIVNTYGVPPEATAWVEYYPPEVSFSLDESFSWVVLPWDLSRDLLWIPQWRFATRASLERLIGQPFAQTQMVS